MRNLQALVGRYWLILFSLAALPVVHAGPSMPEGIRLYAPCMTCHLPNAWGSEDGTTPNLAGQNGHYLENRIDLFKANARLDAAIRVVTPHPAVETANEVALLAEYLSHIEWSPRTVHGSGENLQMAQETYTYICAACHGADGRGQRGSRTPRIAGQHYPYLLIQIEAAAASHRDLAPPEMTSALRSMGSEQKDALADYVSRL